MAQELCIRPYPLPQVLRLSSFPPSHVYNAALGRMLMHSLFFFASWWWGWLFGWLSGLTSWQSGWTLSHPPGCSSYSVFLHHRWLFGSDLGYLPAGFPALSAGWWAYSAVLLSLPSARFLWRFMSDRSQPSGRSKVSRWGTTLWS